MLLFDAILLQNVLVSQSLGTKCMAQIMETYSVKSKLLGHIVWGREVYKRKVAKCEGTKFGVQSMRMAQCMGM